MTMHKNTSDSYFAKDFSTPNHALHFTTQIFDTMYDGVLVHDQGTIIFANAALAALMELDSSQQLLGRNVLEFLSPEDQQRAACRVQQLLSGEITKAETEVFHLLRDNGDDFFAEVQASCLEGEASCILLVLRDITQQRTYLNELTRIQSMMDQAVDMMYMLDLEGNFLMVNKACEQYLKRNRLQLIGESYTPYVAPEQLEKVQNEVQLILDNVKASSAYDLDIIDYDGHRHCMEIRSTIVHDDKGNPIAVQGVLRDLSERKQYEAKIRMLTQAVEQAGESILITNRAGIIEYVNPAFTRITGYEASEVIGQTPSILNSGNHDASFYENMWATIRAGHVWHDKIIDKKKDGSLFPSILTISPLFDGSGEKANYTHFIGIHSDLSALEDMEKRFQKSQKMEAIGTMVGGIAHNFNNMLAGIMGNLYLAKHQLQENLDVVQKLTHAEELSQHAADMIQQLLAFARNGIVSMNELQLVPYLKETLELLHASVPENIAVHEDICSDDLFIKGDATLLSQVLFNLVNNARDAVEDVEAPSISIRLASFETDDAFIESHPYFRAGAYAHLSVEDNGSGIHEDHLGHLFEPFFTTKEQGKGTGLGLSMVYGTVKSHHGFIEVESILGKGSSFHIYISLVEKSVLATQPTEAIEAPQGQGEMILLADDEPMIREVMDEVLKSMGYRVLLAEDGLKAMEVFKANQQHITLALLDAVMPHCGGMELAKRIRSMHPDMPILFLTGYDQEHVLHGEEPLPDCEILTKPVNFDLLNQRIRKMLD